MILHSSAAKLVDETNTMLSGLKTNDAQVLANYQNKCKEITKRGKFWRAVATVVIAASAFLVGAAIGAGVGLAIGAGVGVVTGPGAIATGAVGFFTGTIGGAAIGVTAGSAAAASITGIAVGAASGYLLFKPNKLAKATSAVVAEASSFSVK